MKIYIFLLLNLVLQYTALIDIENNTYENSVKCINVENPNKDNCHSIPYYIAEENITCCYVTYNSDDEGSVEKCVPLYKTINGLHMYEEQLKNIGGTSISMDCSSQRTIMAILMISIIVFLL